MTGETVPLVSKPIQLQRQARGEKRDPCVRRAKCPIMLSKDAGYSFRCSFSLGINVAHSRLDVDRTAPDAFLQAGEAAARVSGLWCIHLGDRHPRSVKAAARRLISVHRSNRGDSPVWWSRQLDHGEMPPRDRCTIRHRRLQPERGVANWKPAVSRTERGGHSIRSRMQPVCQHSDSL